MRNLSFIAFALYCSVVGASWEPPENPDPGQILDSVHEDRKQGNYADALAKHLWIHDNILKIDNSYYGVRLSFALMYWHELAQVYPPAMEAFERKLAEAKKRSILNDSCCDEGIHEYIAFNRTLGRHSDTAEFFEWLSLNNPNQARRYINIAKPSLLQTKRYELLLKYLDPHLEMLRLQNEFEYHSQTANSFSQESELMEFAIKSFTNGSATLVALLVISERHDLAKSKAESALHVYDSESFRSELDDALHGKVPNPWP